MRGTRSSCKREHRFRTKSAFIVLRPQMGAGSLHRQVVPRHAAPPRLDGDCLPSRGERPVPCPRGRNRLPGSPDSARSSRVRSPADRRSATSPVTMSSDSPSASAARSALLPLYLKGSTATQKPSSARRRSRRRAPHVEAGGVAAASFGRLPRQIAKFVADVARCLHAVARIFFQTAPDDARQIGGQIGANVGDRRRSIPQNRGDQLGRRIPLERTPPRRHLVEHDAQRENVGAVVERAARSCSGDM